MAVDTQKLRQAVQNFRFYSRPSSATLGAPATVDDVNKVIDGISKVLSTFIQELEDNT